MSDDLIKHLGSRVVHVTARGNVALIRRDGLLPAAELVRRNGGDPAAARLRRNRYQITTRDGPITLNHQNPINHGLSAANRIVEGHTADSRAALLDERVFFSRMDKNARFRNSIAADLPIVTLSFDTAALLLAMGGSIDLSPLNSGNFTQGGAHAVRGDWLFVPATKGLAEFRTNRQKRGFVKSPDTVKELSVRGAIPPAY